MANEVFNTSEITLDDGKKVTLKPLPIKFLRKFMKEWSEGLDPKIDPETNKATRPITDEVAMDTYTACNGIALSRQLADVIDPVKQYENYKEFSGMLEEYRDYLESNVDIPNTNKILEVCGGIQTDDPKLVEAAVAAMEAGQN